MIYLALLILCLYLLDLDNKVEEKQTEYKESIRCTQVKSTYTDDDVLNDIFNNQKRG